MAGKFFTSWRSKEIIMWPRAAVSRTNASAGVKRRCLAGDWSECISPGPPSRKRDFSVWLARPGCGEAHYCQRRPLPFVFGGGSEDMALNGRLPVRGEDCDEFPRSNCFLRSAGVFHDS